MSDRTFRVRHYECDAYGHLNHAVYLRYVEEVELDRKEVAFPLRRLEVEYLRPVVFGEEVRVSPGPPDEKVCRYRFFAGDEAVATADVGWDGTTRASLPAPGPEPEVVFEHEREVHWRDVDDSGRVGSGVLAGYAEDAGVAVCADRGWPLERCSTEGFAMVLRRIEADVRLSPQLGDRVAIRTFASDPRRASAHRHYVMSVGGSPAARFRSLYAWVSTVSGRPVRIPEQFRRDFASNFVA